MKRGFKIITVCLLVSLLALSLAACGGGNTTQDQNQGTQQDKGTQTSGEKIVWKLGHLGNEEHIWNRTALYFGELLAEKTNGQIELKVYPNEQLGSEIDNINMIKAGTADLVVSGESMQNWAPKTALIATPYAFRDADHMRRVLESELGQEIKDEIEEKVGLKALYYHVRAPRNLTSNRPISKPEDLKGFKMRVPNVPVFIEAWKAAGASPQALAFSEVFTAIQQGVIEGQENPVDLINSGGLYEVQKYVNETEHVNGFVFVLVGKKQFESLSPELQQAVLEAAAEAQAYGDKLFEEEIADITQQLKDKGMIFNSDVDKEAFRKAMEPGIKAIFTEEQMDLYNRIIEFK